jgi:hypothetical protein
MADNEFPVHLFIIGGILIVFIIAALNNEKAKFKRRLKKSPLKKIGEIQDGEVVRFVGKVEFIDEPVIAPLSFRPSAFYYVEVEKKVKSGKSSTWRTIIKEQRRTKFAIRDENGIALIDQEHFKSLVVMDERHSSGTFNDATEELEAFLNSHGYQSEGSFGFNKTLRYHEGVLEKDETVAVLGQGHWIAPSELDLDLPDEKILVMSPPPNEPLYISDEPEMTSLPDQVKKEKRKKRTIRRNEKRNGRYLK